MAAKLVHFAGTVQGVGFRYTARSISRGFDVTGYVMNLPDGRVEVLIEGADSDVAEFIERVRTEMGSYVTSVEAKDVVPTGTYRQFVVRCD